MAASTSDPRKAINFLPINMGRVEIYNADGQCIGWVHPAQPSALHDATEASYDEVMDAFAAWADSPEASLVAEIITSDDPIELQSTYERLLKGCLRVQAYTKSTEPEVFNRHSAAAARAISWLQTGTDFYTAPASTKYHDSDAYGLLRHSLDVAAQIQSLTLLPKFQHVPIWEAILVALLHDWCKIGVYESYTKNVKVDGQWTQETAWRYRTDGSPFPLGHGETSMYLASRFFSLSIAAAAALRWHMGAWHASLDQRNDLNTANCQYPLVLMLQFADSLACARY